MSSLSPLPALLAFFLALLTAYFLMKKEGIPELNGRFATIDGLRGFLGFSVFLQHAALWYFYLRTDKWTTPPSNLYVHFGQTGVALFFMITSFLFFSKILEAQHKGIDWFKLFVSRFLRLMPLYLVMMALVLCLVAYVSGGVLKEPLPVLLLGIFRWMTFTILGTPDLNGMVKTAQITAAVTWSLPYEWFFYLLLPACAWVLGMKVRTVYLAVSGITLLLIFLRGMEWIHWLPFLGGIAAAYVARSEEMSTRLKHPVFSILAILLMVTTITFYYTAYGVIQTLLLSGFFIIVASGNSLFGMLTAPVSRKLGEMAYGIYLLHGIFLFTAFKIILNQEQSVALSPIEYWGVVLLMTPLLILVTHFCYKHIEHPALKQSGALTHYLRNRMPPLQKRQ